jgi:hypothetical protein
VETDRKPPVNWPAIRADFELTRSPLRVIGAQHAISHTAIRKRAMAEGWTRPAAAVKEPTPIEVRTEAPERRPKAILEDIAASELAPAAARVAACKILLGLDRQMKPTAEDTNMTRSGYLALIPPTQDR